MPLPKFTPGRALALNLDGFTSALSVLDTSDVRPALLWTVMSVECGPWGGFIPDRRPVILFERHLFSRYTSGTFDSLYPDISSPSPGGYGNLGAAQYVRLGQAAELDRQAACLATSWGMGQVLGSNHMTAGYITLDLMLQSMFDSESSQVRAMVKFIASNPAMEDALLSRNWKEFARRYNGPNYAENQYDIKLSVAYDKVLSHPPDLTIRACQLYLRYAGLNPGPVDGIMGDKTAAAVMEFGGRMKIPGVTPEKVVKMYEVNSSVPVV